MNNTRSVWLSSILVVMAGCGGGGGDDLPGSNAGSSSPPPQQSSTYSVGGTVSGVAGTGVTLQVNGHSNVVVTSDGDFTFTDKFSSGAAYQVSIAAQPANPTETCVVADGGGAVGTANVSNVRITCSANSFSVGGTVAGLSGTLVLSSPGIAATSLSASGNFTLSAPIASGSAYDITVSTQPANQSCSVLNGSGTVGAASISNVSITCTTGSYTLGGMVSGLHGTGLLLSNGGANLSIPASGAFTFGSALASGTPYNVTVSSQPANPAQTCAVTNASGTITSANVSNLAVTCANDDVTSPAVTVTSPFNTAVGAGPQLAITATFSEALNAATVTVSSFGLTGPSGVVSGTVTLTGGNKASFTPDAPLEFNTTYQARLTTAIRDLSGNALAADEVWSFNTGQKLSLGASHACVRYDGGQLKCWGNNSKGQLGLGNTNSRGDAAGEMGAALPTVNLGTGRVAVDVVAGGEHTCARLDNNQVKCWGSSQYGQLGLGGTANHGDNAGEMGDSLPTVQLGTDDVVLQLTAGRYFTCARLASGEVKCWGRNDKGQLGVGDTASRGDNSGEMGDALADIDLGTGRTAIDISATAYHMCARLDNNTAKCWGENDFGQLGLGDTNSRGDAPGEMGNSLPVLNAGTGRTIRQIAVNSGHTCALLDTNGIKCWGHNLYGQLGLGDIEYRGDTPSEVGDGVPTVDFGTGRTATHVVEGSRHTCVLLDTSRVKCWGYNPNGELGLGDADDRGDAPGEMGDSLPTVNLGTGRTVVELESGSFFVCARLDDDEIKCWGRNLDGELGQGDVNSRGDAPGEMGDSLPGVDLSL